MQAWLPIIVLKQSPQNSAEILDLSDLKTETSLYKKKIVHFQNIVIKMLGEVKRPELMLLSHSLN